MMAVIEGVNELLFAEAKDPALASGDVWGQLFQRPAFQDLAGSVPGRQRGGGRGEQPDAEAYEQAISKSLEQLLVMSKYNTKYKRAFYQLLSVVAQKEVHSIPLVMKTFRLVRARH
jgi:hypothetical protein